MCRLPQASQNVTCSGDWVDASGGGKSGEPVRDRGQAGCASRESSSAASKVCSPDKLCTCPISAQGFLEAKGSYQVEAAGENVKIDTEAKPVTFAAGSLAEGRLDVGDAGKLAPCDA